MGIGLVTSRTLTVVPPIPCEVFSHTCRFCKPQAKLGLQYLGSDGATDTGQQRLRDSEAAARGKGYEVLHTLT